MSSNLWFLFFLIKYISLFSSKRIGLGLVLILLSFLRGALIITRFSSWYAILFFLVYVGGVLVLFIYISSIKRNPSFKLFTKNKLLLVSSLTFFFISFPVVKDKVNGWETFKKSKYFKLTLFSSREKVLIIKIGLLLLFVLWIISKLSFRKSGALRPA